MAAAGLVRHVWLQRRKHRLRALAALDAAHETDVEVDPEFDGADEGLLARGPEPIARTKTCPSGRLEEFF